MAIAATSLSPSFGTSGSGMPHTPVDLPSQPPLILPPTAGAPSFGTASAVDLVIEDLVEEVAALERRVEAIILKTTTLEAEVRVWKELWRTTMGKLQEKMASLKYTREHIEEWRTRE